MGRTSKDATIPVDLGPDGMVKVNGVEFPKGSLINVQPEFRVTKDGDQVKTGRYVVRFEIPTDFTIHDDIVPELYDRVDLPKWIDEDGDERPFSFAKEQNETWGDFFRSVADRYDEIDKMLVRNGAPKSNVRVRPARTK